MADERHDPFRSFNFRLEIDNLPVAAFSEVSGLNAEANVAEYRTGTAAELHVTKLPGLHKHGNVTLKRGMVKDSVLWDWFRNIENGVTDRRDGAVVLMDEQRLDVLRWTFAAAWPAKMSFSDLKAAGNEIAIESVELVVETMRLQVA
jgi:phage tail-like protein